MSQNEMTIRPVDFSFRYDWAEATLPPPHYYTYAIRVTADGMGVYEMVPEAAIAAARKIVDDCLLKACRPAITAAELLRGYRAYGEDPFIVPSQAQARVARKDEVLFSAWQYAQLRCAELCGEQSN